MPPPARSLPGFPARKDGTPTDAWDSHTRLRFARGVLRSNNLCPYHLVQADDCPVYVCQVEFTMMGTEHVRGHFQGFRDDRLGESSPDQPHHRTPQPSECWEGNKARLLGPTILATGKLLERPGSL